MGSHWITLEVARLIDQNMRKRLEELEDENAKLKAELENCKLTFDLRDTIEEQNKQIEALKRDVLEKTAEVRNLKEVIADLHNQADDDLDSIETERIENARLKTEIERLGAFKTHTIIPNEKLEAQIKRLIKAGDNLVYVASEDPAFEPFIKAWFAAKQAAKDGKDTQ